MNKNILLIAAIFLILAVAIGAFGAHGLKSHLSDELIQIYKTGVEYHFYHALGLLLVGIFSITMPSKYIKWSAVFLTVGIILFSGSLYAIATTGIKGFGVITPIGGLCFIAGWVLLFIAILKHFK